MVGPSKTHYAGRFRFDLPPSYLRASQTSAVKEVEVIEVALPPGMSVEDGRRAFWQKHLEAIRAEYTLHQKPRILEEGELRPGVPRVFYLGYTPDDRILEVLLTDKDRGALVKAAWRLHVYEAERPAELAERQHAFAEVAGAHKFLPPGYAPIAPDWFYLPHGAIALPHQSSDREHQERLGLSFKDSDSTDALSFEAKFPDQQDEEDRPGFLARLAKTVAGMAIVGARTLRSGKRVVAGFRGDEALVHVKDDHELLFGWTHEPDAKDQGYQPKIVIQMRLEDRDQEAKVALWDRLLDGIQRVSPGN